jgi:8-oxo-dGTP pyrophosphatase MutT (NUDIX family)
LVLLYPFAGEAFIVLTVRSSRLPSHAGQVSLPGGAVEPGETIEEAALREAQEEIGLEPRGVRLIGRLTPLHIPVSGFILHGVVGIADERPRLHPSDQEVERVLEVPLAGLVDPARRAVRHQTYDGTEFEIPYIDVDGAELWGATAMVLSELLSLLEV